MLRIQQIDYKFKTALIPESFSDKLIQEFYEIFYPSKQKIESLQTYCEMIKSENTLVLYQGLVGLRIILSDQGVNEEFKSIQQAVYEQNTLKYIIHIIEYNENQLILYEALWILRTLAYEQTIISIKIIENGSFNFLVRKFSSEYYHDFIIEQVCWIFANVTDNFQYQNYFFKLGIIKILNNYAIKRANQNDYLIDPLAKAISNCFRFQSNIILQDIEVSLKCFKNWIQEIQSTQTFSYICQSFTNYAEFNPCNIQNIIDFGIMPRIIELFQLGDYGLFAANIKIVQKILESHQGHQEYLYRIGIIPCLGRLIEKYNERSLYIILILQAFKAISLSENLRSYLLDSQELDQLLQFSKSDLRILQNRVHDIIGNLIEAFQTIASITFIQSKKLIQLCKIFISRNQTEQRYQKLCQIIINLCDKYLKDESLSEKEELLDLKHKIVKKLCDLK